MSAHDDLMRSLGRLESSVTGCRTDITELRGEVIDAREIHETRLGTLEVNQGRAKGVLATIAVTAGIVGSYFGLK